jgi:hypothetical protein
MKLEAAFRRKLVGRSSNLLLGGIFFAGIVVGIVVTIITIATLPDSVPGKRAHSSQYEEAS